MNPAYPHVFATVSEADTLVVFSALTKKVSDGQHADANNDQEVLNYEGLKIKCLSLLILMSHALAIHPTSDLSPSVW